MNRFDFIEQKILTVEQAKQRCSLWKLKNDKVVFTNGCFDILHAGHVTYLAQAASLGNRLVIGLNDDQSVRLQNKDVNRPINDENSRALVLAALGFVDAIVLFSETTPEKLILELCPDVLVKGGDYNANETDNSSSQFIVGSDFVRSRGGLVSTIDLVQGFSTTIILSKLEK
jgi:rfaE bifunctional protein nucleotidyltransferase chain/domain